MERSREELTDRIEMELDEAEREAESTEVRYTHDEVFEKIREGVYNG